MDIASNVKLRLDKGYIFSISQEVDRPTLVEAALLNGKRFVHCGEWCVNWVGEEYDDEVVRFVDAHDVLELLNFAKEYVYIKDKQNVSP